MAHQVLHNVIVRLPDSFEKRSIWGFTVYIQDLPGTITTDDIMEMGNCVGPVVEIRHFVKDQEAHLQFGKIEDAMRFMEVFNKKPIKTGLRTNVFKPLMSPSWDYPCLSMTPIPGKMTDDELIQLLQNKANESKDKIEVLRVTLKDGYRRVVQFGAQRMGTFFLKHIKDHPIEIAGRKINIRWEKAPCARVDFMGFTDKTKIFRAFDVIPGKHVLGVAMLQDRAFVYFDYRVHLEAAAAKIGPNLRIQLEDGTTQEFQYYLM